MVHGRILRIKFEQKILLLLVKTFDPLL